MLAGERKRRKYCLNPQGNFWKNDTSKVGQKLLEKMGWKEGQGLGAKNQGIVVPLKVRFKCDTTGFGSKESEDLIKQQKDYLKLLSNLNCESIETIDSSKVKSLEEKSKQSRARVHYQKFTRGKDLSRYSSKDLKCIFGIQQGTENEVENSNKIDCFSDVLNRETPNELTNDELKEEEIQMDDDNDKLEFADHINHFENSKTFKKIPINEEASLIRTARVKKIERFEEIVNEENNILETTYINNHHKSAKQCNKSQETVDNSLVESVEKQEFEMYENECLEVTGTKSKKQKKGKKSRKTEVALSIETDDKNEELESEMNGDRSEVTDVTNHQKKNKKSKKSRRKEEASSIETDEKDERLEQEIDDDNDDRFEITGTKNHLEKPKKCKKSQNTVDDSLIEDGEKNEELGSEINDDRLEAIDTTNHSRKHKKSKKSRRKEEASSIQTDEKNVELESEINDDRLEATDTTNHSKKHKKRKKSRRAEESLVIVKLKNENLEQEISSENLCDPILQTPKKQKLTTEIDDCQQPPEQITETSNTKLSNMKFRTSARRKGTPDEHGFNGSNLPSIQGYAYVSV